MKRLLVLLLIGGMIGGIGYRLLNSGQKPIEPEELTGEWQEGEKWAVFNNEEVQIINYVSQIKEDEIKEMVLGETSEPKRIEVNLTDQRLYGFEGEKLVHNYLVSTGKWGRTPIGVFRIWVKLRYSKMEGGSKAKRTYYYLPNVPYVMYLESEEIPRWRGYGLHGTYWHDNFGHPMSHGCINMKTEEVEQLYYWADPALGEQERSVWSSENNPGTTVVIYGIAPAV